MFLNQLNKEEKIAFLELVHYIARSDNDFSKAEKTTIWIKAILKISAEGQALIYS